MSKEVNPHADNARRPFWESMGQTLRELNDSFLGGSADRYFAITTFRRSYTDQVKGGLFGRID